MSGRRHRTVAAVAERVRKFDRPRRAARLAMVGRRRRQDADRHRPADVRLRRLPAVGHRHRDRPRPEPAGERVRGAAGGTPPAPHHRSVDDRPRRPHRRSTARSGSTTPPDRPGHRRSEPAPVAACRPIAEGDPIARIEIAADRASTRSWSPGVSPADLKKGPGHYPETPLPGQLGNSAIAGHRTTYGQPFYDIDELDAGDEIVVTTLAGPLRLPGDGQQIVSPERLPGHRHDRSDASPRSRSRRVTRSTRPGAHRRLRRARPRRLAPVVVTEPILNYGRRRGSTGADRWPTPTRRTRPPTPTADDRIRTRPFRDDPTTHDRAGPGRRPAQVNDGIADAFSDGLVQRPGRQQPGRAVGPGARSDRHRRRTCSAAGRNATGSACSSGSCRSSSCCTSSSRTSTGSSRRTSRRRSVRVLADPSRSVRGNARRRRMWWGHCGSGPPWLSPHDARVMAVLPRGKHPTGRSDERDVPYAVPLAHRSRRVMRCDEQGVPYAVPLAHRSRGVTGCSRRTSDHGNRRADQAIRPPPRSPRPVNSGRRFSRNAVRPSSASSLAQAALAPDSTVVVGIGFGHARVRGQLVAGDRQRRQVGPARGPRDRVVEVAETVDTTGARAVARRCRSAQRAASPERSAARTPSPAAGSVQWSTTRPSFAAGMPTTLVGVAHPQIGGDRRAAHRRRAPARRSLRSPAPAGGRSPAAPTPRSVANCPSSTPLRSAPALNAGGVPVSTTARTASGSRAAISACTSSSSSRVA